MQDIAVHPKQRKKPVFAQQIYVSVREEFCIEKQLVGMFGKENDGGWMNVVHSQSERFKNS